MMVGLMQGWNLWKRFALFAVLGAALVAAPLAMYVRESSSAIAAAQAEQRGIEPTKKLLGVIRLAQQHRGLSANVLTGTSNMDAQRRAKRAELDAAIKAFGATVGELGSGTIARDWADSVRTWDALAQAVDSNSLSASESFGRHTSLIDRYLVLVESIADHSGLALDSQADSYNLMRATVIDLPYVTEALGQARARGAAYLAKKQASAVERASLASLTAIAATHQRTMYRAFDKATAGGAELKTKLDGMLKASADEVNRAFKLATQEVVEAEKLAMPSADYFKVFTEAIDAQFKLNSLGLDELDKLLSQRVSDLRSGQLLVLGVIAAVVLLSLWVGTAVTRSVLGQMGGEPKEAMDVAARVAAGDLAEEIALRPGDRNSLMAAMASMQSVLRQFVSAQERIKQEHDAGMIDYRIDATRFQGSFRDMAQLANELVASHIAVQTRIVEVVKSYAAGDLAPDMDRLPGAKARITEAIDGVKAGLKSVNAQIQMLAQAASRGDFSVRGDEAKFSDEFRAMVSALNRLMDVANVGLSDVSRMLGAMARGDLTQRITAPYEGTFDRLKQDANRTAESLAAIVAGIRETTDAITTATKEIAQGNADLSGRTEAQASSLEETASSMEELTSTVKQNAQNARQANQLAISACDVAVKGGDVVNQVVTTMGSINESSAKIVDIIAVIDGIAFQTNILALNAAVEAARAGEQGRGFAVVATEVRNLAQRSAAAAKEIKTLISNSVEKVDFGSKLVDRAGETMAQVVASIKRVTDIVAEITVASQEQSSGIEQVNQAVTQMDESTQQNTALVEEAAAAAESLQEQANALTSAVARFQVKSGRPDASSSGSAAQQGRSTQAPNVTRVPAAGGRSVVPALAT